MFWIVRNRDVVGVLLYQEESDLFWACHTLVAVDESVASNAFWTSTFHEPDVSVVNAWTNEVESTFPGGWVGRGDEPITVVSMRSLFPRVGGARSTAPHAVSRRDAWAGPLETILPPAALESLRTASRSA